MDQVVRILLVEDDRDTREILSWVLGHDGFEVAEASNGERALELMRECPPDLVLLDFAMPVLDGRDVIEAMRKDLSLRKVPVVTISASPQALQMAASAHVAKPFAMADLLGAIRRALHCQANDAPAAQNRRAAAAGM